MRNWTREEQKAMYLDWFNNFLTVGRFAEYYGIEDELLAVIVIDNGRMFHNEDIAKVPFINQTKGQAL